MTISEPAPAVPETTWAFLTEREAATVDAVAARIFPSDPRRPGAREARVVCFIDRALAETSGELGECYRQGARELDLLCGQRHGTPFAQLTDELQDQILRVVDGPEASRRLATFFAVVREHTIQGMFCDPEYGGNHHGVGWKLVGFPGAQWGYGAEQMRPGFDSTAIPIKTLEDLRREVRAMGTAAAGATAEGISA
jgi:gluconate 2-dehydrogenase gamma chain